MLAVGVALVAAVSYAAVSRDLQASIDRDLLEETRAFSAALLGEVPESTEALVEASRAYLAARQPGSLLAPILLVQLEDGTVISNTDLTLERAWLGGPPPGPGFSTLAYEGAEYRMATAPVLAEDGSALGSFHAAIALDEARSLQAGLATSLAWIGFGVVLIGGALSYWVARAALDPLRKVADTASRITHSSLTDRVEYSGPDDEVGTVVSALNAMLDRLEAAFGEQRRFVADASHELRTPLAVIRGNLELLERPDGDESDRAEALCAVRDELARTERLVEDLLALARLEDGTPRRPFQPLDVSILLQELSNRARVLGSRTIEIAAIDGLWVLGDPDLLEGALANLVGNAVRHTAAEGRISLGSRPAGDAVVITIADDGPGIPEQHLDRVFERFHRVPSPRDTEGGGSGLGLAITQRVVDVHGGTISAENAPGGGAVFTVSLPRYAGEHADPPPG